MNVVIQKQKGERIPARKIISHAKGFPCISIPSLDQNFIQVYKAGKKNPNRRVS